VKIFGITIVTTRAHEEHTLLSELRAFNKGFQLAKEILQRSDPEMQKYEEFAKHYFPNKKV
jgi:hypothetical protein